MRQENELAPVASWMQKPIIRGFFKLHILVQIVVVMIGKNVNWEKAKSTVDRRYYDRCLNTGKENFLYRPAILPGEIGPQMTGSFIGRSWWDIILLIIMAFYVSKKLKR